MARPKNNKTIKSISFDNEVLEALENRCRKEKIAESTFVNDVIKRIVMSEREYYRHLCKRHAAEMHKYKLLMDTAIEGDNYENN